MEKLDQQVRAAQRRLNLQKFVTCLPWCWFAGLIAAVIAIGVHERYPITDPFLWNAAWLAGCLVLGAVAAAIWTWVAGHKSLEAAIEIDHRFGLKERVSSTLAMNAEDRQTEAGQAVIADAVRRVDRLQVTDRFGITVGRKILLPVIPALLAIAVVFMIDEKGQDKNAQAKTDEQAQKQVKESSNALRKKIEERRKQAKALGLKEAEEVLKEIDDGLRDMDKKKDVDRKQAMIKLNNLADKLEKRQKSLGGSDEMRKQLDKMKDFKRGPADRLARALKQGKFKDALKQLDELKKKLAENKLTDEEKKQLAEQLDQMKQKMEEIADAHKDAMEKLKNQIKQARDSGDIEQANKLQQALDKLAQKMPQMDQMRNMANKCDSCSKAMKAGDGKAAERALNDLAGDLEKMQSELNELETLKDAMEEIQQAKNAMDCQKCGGGGCEACQGGGKDGKGGGGGDKMGKGGDGLGAGKAGRGDRPLSETDVKTYDSRVRAKVGKGAAVITGEADGPNAKGKVREALQEDFKSKATGPADPLTGQRLPKSHQRHVEEYFELLREGS